MSEQKSKNPLQKLKEKFDDKEEQLEILGTFIRLGVMVWAGFIISLNYISLPGMAKDNSPKANMRKTMKIFAKTPTAVAAYFRVRKGKKIISPDKKLSFSENFFKMMFNKVPDKEIVRAFDISLIE